VDRQPSGSEGEFGNGTRDDTDLLGDWVSLALLSDRDQKIRNSHRLLTDFVWEHCMESGLNKNLSDALHAYEAGNNMQPFAALLDYGDPVLVERQFMTSRRYDGFLMTDPVDGKRRLAGEFFSSKEVRAGSRYKKESHNRLLLHAGLYTLFHNGHPGLLQMMTEYYDGAPSLRRGPTGDLELALYTHTGDKRFVERCKYSVRHFKWPPSPWPRQGYTGGPQASHQSAQQQAADTPIQRLAFHRRQEVSRRGAALPVARALLQVRPGHEDGTER